MPGKRDLLAKSYTAVVKSLFLALFLVAAAAPARAESVAVSTSPVHGPALRLVPADQLPDFHETFQSKAGLLKAARKTLAYLKEGNPPKYFKVADREYAPGILVDSLEELVRIAKTATTQDEFAQAIKDNFDVFQSAGSDDNGRVVFSSYYQPVLPASRKKTPKYNVPLYKRPPDMVEVDLAAFGKRNGDDSALIGRVDRQKRVVPYFTRADIDIKRTLRGKGLEVAWLKNKFDALDLHVQGSGILKYPDGTERLAKYAGTNNQPYNSVGLLLVKANIFSRDEITRDKVRDYLHQHPEAEDWILAQNPRYTFFDIAPLPADGEPFGSVQQSLVPARSIAIDPAVIPLGAIAYFTTTSPQADKEGRLLGQFPNSRFALCMDTGGAIKGPGRVDIYAGHGPQAEVTARNQWAEGKLYILIKKLPPRER